MTYDARFTCPICGRAGLSPDTSLFRPAQRAKMQREWDNALADRGGMLRPRSTQECINGHRWVVPDAEALPT